jgi:hypothetical protein
MGWLVPILSLEYTSRLWAIAPISFVRRNDFAGYDRRSEGELTRKQ